MIAELPLLQKQSDPELERRMRVGDDIENPRFLETLGSGLFTASVRDSGRYTGKRSAIMPADKDWSLLLEFSGLESMCTFLDTDEVTDRGGNRCRSYLRLKGVKSARLHCQFARLKDRVPLPHQFKVELPRQKSYSIDWTHDGGP